MAQHNFYFVFYDNKEENSERKHVEKSANKLGLSLHIEKHQDVTTLQVETDDANKAILFKLMVVPPTAQH